MDGFFFVAGSAHLDLLARVTGRTNVVDRIGDVSVEVGGSAANVALNLAHFGHPVRLLTAMNRSPFSSVVLSYLQDNNVEPYVVFDDDLPIGAFSAHIDLNGEMVSAITSTPVDRVVFEENYLMACLKGARAAVVDCNLSAATLDLLADLCVRLKIPCFCSAVSEPKILRIADVTHSFAGIFLNRREAHFFKEQRMANCDGYEDMASHLGTTFYVTRDESGVAITDGAGTLSVDAPSLQEASGNKLGLGDAFMSAVVHEIVTTSVSPAEASKRALAYVRTLADKNNCNIGKEGSVLSILESRDRDAHYDSLTGVFNRRASELALMRAATDASQSHAALAVILIDIDHFKTINDQYGHAKGDAVLAQVSDVIQKTMRDMDSVGRWGGEEFLCILPGSSIDVARKVSERICVSVRRNITVPRTLTVSCGVAAHRMNEAFSDVVERADRALYKAKELGRNRVVTEAVV